MSALSATRMMTAATVLVIGSSDCSVDPARRLRDKTARTARDNFYGRAEFARRCLVGRCYGDAPWWPDCRRWWFHLARRPSGAGIAQRALPPDITWILKEAAQFPDDRLQALERGEVISRAGSSDGDLEAAVIAAVRIRAAKELTASYFRQIVDFEDGEVTLQHAAFSQPPKTSDVARLTSSNDERENLRSCRPGDCDVRIGAAGAREVASAVELDRARRRRPSR